MTVKKLCSVLAMLCIMACTTGAYAAGGTKLTWYGHAAFKIVTPEGHVVLIDPWITNPANKSGKADLAGLTKADLILVSHGHFDHVGDSAAIARATGAQLVCSPELSEALVQFAGFPAAQATGNTVGNAGGTISFLGGDVEITFIQAVHSTGVAIPANMRTDQNHREPGGAGGGIGVDGPSTLELPANAYGGSPLGFLVKVRNGPAIYHTGDTDVFYDMALIPKIHKVDVMLACIGDKYTMGPARAALAADLVRPTVIVPMHFGTFPALTGTPQALGKALSANHSKTKMLVMQVHQTISL